MRTFALELRHASRLLRKTPLISAVAILTLALGIGANVAIFSVVQGVLLRPPPFRDPERLMIIWERMPKFPEASCAYLDYVDWRHDQKQFADVAVSRREFVTLTGLGAPERLTARQASANFFRVLGVEPILGRDFAEGEDATGAAPVTIVSSQFFRERLHGDAGAVGKTIALDGKAVTVIGVLPPGFRYVDDYPLWITLADLDPMPRNNRGTHPGLYGVARLKPGVTVAQGRLDLETIAHRRFAAQPKETRVLPALAPFQQKQTEDVRATLWLLLGAVGLVLLIACANVANLMLARGTARARELAVRAAVGASRWDLMRPLLLESAIIAVGGALFGVVLALWGVDVLAALRPDSLPRTAEIAVDRTVLGYSLGLTTLTALLCGLVPAFKASRTDLNEALKSAGARGVAGVAHGRLRATLVVAEVAMALVLLVGAGLSLRTFQHLEHIDPGFTVDDLTTMSVAVSPDRHPDGAAVRALVDELRRRLTAMPGVTAMTISDSLPFFGASEQSFRVASHPNDERFAVAYFGSPGFLKTTGVSLLAGRDLDDDDDLHHELVALVDAELARSFFPGGAVGQQFNFGTIEKPMMVRVVGVVRPILHYGLEGEVPARYQIYMSLGQVPDQFLTLMRDLHISLRGPHAADLVAPARAVIAAVDPQLPISDVKTMEQEIADSLGGRRFAMFLFGLFASVALSLALVGLYAVMSYVVTQRYHEIGVRMALGAQARDVERMILRQGLALVGIGLVVGLATSLALTRVLAALVSGLSPTDPLTYGVVAGLLTAAAALASFVPARAATKVDPMVVLRYE